MCGACGCDWPSPPRPQEQVVAEPRDSSMTAPHGAGIPCPATVPSRSPPLCPADQALDYSFGRGQARVPVANGSSSRRVGFRWTDERHEVHTGARAQPRAGTRQYMDDVLIRARFPDDGGAVERGRRPPFNNSPVLSKPRSSSLPRSAAPALAVGADGLEFGGGTVVLIAGRCWCCPAAAVPRVAERGSKPQRRGSLWLSCTGTGADELVDPAFVFGLSRYGVSARPGAPSPAPWPGRAPRP